MSYSISIQKLIMNAYFPWFLFLLDLEDENDIDGDYQPPENIDDPDEEFEDELDEEFEENEGGARQQ